jgi:phospholipase C
VDRLSRLIRRALGFKPPAGAGLGDIEHVVILMQENRSFDSYFGTLSGVRGFSEPGVTTFSQYGYLPGKGPDPDGFLQPFRLATDLPKADGQSPNDIVHDWAPQHESWNNGAMDGFVKAHLRHDGPVNGPVTMGYYTRSDLPFYHALADAFTICDGYHASVIGPTDPNRIMALTGTIDPDGKNGGPIVQTFADRYPEYHKLSWETMPERLLDAGVSWKIYNAPLGLAVLSPLPYFKAYDDPLNARGRALIDRGMCQLYPHHFREDVAAGKLPAVSWIIAPLAECEHPAAPPHYGEYFVHEVLDTLVANPDVWERTVVFVVYDENGGFFDHVPPTTAPRGTPGEWLTTLPDAAGGIAGPIGLGFRVPCMVISPFSRGGYRCADTFDHTSLLKFIERRFGVEAPNISAWRRAATGDLTSALALGRPPDTGVPKLPPTSLGDVDVFERSVMAALAGTLDVGSPYPIPGHNVMPVQETGPARPVSP